MLPLSPQSAGAPFRLLIVEDEPVVRAMLTAWSHSEGFKSECAATVQEALGLLAAGEFDLLLSDINLPDGDGPELVNALSVANRGLPVIFLTGQPSLESAMQSVKLRIVAYLVKPPDLDELRMLVRREVVAYRNRRLLAASRRHLQAWDTELAQIEAMGDTEGGRPLQDYLQLSLRHFATLLAELEQSVAVLGGDPAGRAALGQVALMAGLRRAVQVLEETRVHFKSKELGNLRRDLDLLLRGTDEAAGDEKPLKPRGNGPINDS